MGRRVSSFSAYVAAAQVPPSTKPASSASPLASSSSSPHKPSSLAWKRRKSSQRSWVELEETRTRKPDGQIIDSGENGWSDADKSALDDEEENGTITFGGGGALSPGLLKGETINPNAPLSSPNTSTLPSNNTPSGRASKTFTFGSRRRSSAPKPPTPTLKVQPPNIPTARSTYTPHEEPDTPSREETAAAERERRAADHRVKMAIRKQEEDLEEIKLKNELRALERKVRHGMRGWQDRDEAAVPPVPALPISSSNESGHPLSAQGSTQADATPSGAMDDAEEPGLAVPMGGRPRRMSTLTSQSKSYENHHVYVGGPSSYHSGHSVSSGSSSQEASSSAYPPTLPLNLPGTSLGTLTKARANRPPSLVLPLSDKFTALPKSQLSPNAPIVSPLSHLRNSYLATYTPFPPSASPPLGPYIPTNRVSLLSPTGEAVSRPEYSLPTSPSARSDSSGLSIVIDDYIHSSDEEDNLRTNSDSDDASDEDGDRESRRVRKKTASPRYRKDSGAAGSRKSSVPFAFDPEEWRPTSFALPPLTEEPSSSSSPVLSANKTPLRGQDFWSGEGPSAGTFPRKMSRVEPPAGTGNGTSDRESRIRFSGVSRARSGRSSRRSRGARGGVAGQESGEENRAWNEVERDEEKDGWSDGAEQVENVFEVEQEEEEVLGWSRRLAHLTILFPFAMLGLMVVSLVCLSSFRGNA